MKIRGDGKLTQDSDSPLFWILRGAYSTGKHEVAKQDREIERLQHEITAAKRKQESAAEKRDAAVAHAAELGWTLIFDYEKS